MAGGRGGAFVNLVKLGVKRVKGEEGLDKAAAKVRDRLHDEPIVQEQLPEDLPNVNTPEGADKPVPQGADPGDPAPAPPAPRQGDPFDEAPQTPEEFDRTLESVEEPVPTVLEHSNLNRQRIDTEEDVGNFVDELVRQQEARGKPVGEGRSFEQIKAGAKRIKWRDITEKASNKSPLNDEELRYAREAEAGLLEDLQREALDILGLKRKGELTPEREFQFRTNAAKLAAISRYISGEKRRTAQILASLRDVAGNDFLRAAQRDEMLKSVGTGQKNIENLAGSLAAARSVDEVVKTIDPFSKVRTSARYLGNWWYNVILSQFAIAKAALGGVVIGKMLFPVEALAAATIGKATRGLRDPGSQAAHNREVRLGEAGVELMGVFTGLRDAIAPLVKHLEDPNYNLGRTAFGRKPSPNDVLIWNAAKGKPLPVNVMAQLVDAVTQNGSSRLLAMNDIVVKSTVFQQKVKAFAFRVAANEGLEGAALNVRVSELLDQMPDEMFEKGFNAGREATLTQELWPILERLNKPFVKTPGVKFLAPFTTTVFAGAQMALERTPLLSLAMSPAIRKAWMQGGAARDEIMGRWTVGSMLIGYGIYEQMAGNAVSGQTLEKNKQFHRMTSGWRPDSWFIPSEDSPGGYAQVNFLSPVHEMVFVGAAVGELVQKLNTEHPVDSPQANDSLDIVLNIAASMGFMFADVTLNKSIGRSLRDLLKVFEDPTKHAGKKGINTMTPMLQVWGAKHVRRAIDPVRRRVPEPEGAGSVEDYVQLLIDTVKNGTPGLSDDLPPHIGFFGELRPEYSMLDVFSYSPQDPNVRLWHMLQRNNTPTRNPSVEMAMPVSGMKINLDQGFTPDRFKQSYIDDNPEADKRGYAYMRYSEIRGEMYKLVLGLVVDSPLMRWDSNDKGSYSIEVEGENIYAGGRLPPGEALNQDNVYTQGDLIRDLLSKANTLAATVFEAEMARAIGQSGYTSLVEEMRNREQKIGHVTKGVDYNIDKQEERIRNLQPVDAEF